MIKFDFTGKVVLVTGASGSLGREISLQLCQMGAEVILHYNSSNEEMNTLVCMLKAMQHKFDVIKADFENIEEVKKMVDYLNNNYKSIDILINNAAINIEKFMIGTSESDFNKIMLVNVKAHYFIIKGIIRKMIFNKEGCIVNIISSIVKRSKKKETLYAASKGSIEAITRVLAAEVGDYNIRVNAVSPGPFISKINPMNEVEKEIIKRENAIHKIVSVEEVANVILFLCSEYASGITGQNIFVDNGFSL